MKTKVSITINLETEDSELEKMLLNYLTDDDTVDFESISNILDQFEVSVTHLVKEKK